METNEVDALLTVLRKQGVVEFSQDTYGLKVKFGDMPSVLDPAIEAIRTELEHRLHVEHGRPDTTVTEPVTYDIADALYGAK